MKVIVVLIMLCASISATSQMFGRDVTGCPSHITLEVAREKGQSIYMLQQEQYAKYPLDTIGKLVNRCTQIKAMYIIVDSNSTLDDIVTALNGSGKNQIDRVLIFMKKNGYFSPVTIGDQSSVDPSK